MGGHCTSKWRIQQEKSPTNLMRRPPLNNLEASLHLPGQVLRPFCDRWPNQETLTAHIFTSLVVKDCIHVYLKQCFGEVSKHLVSSKIKWGKRRRAVRRQITTREASRRSGRVWAGLPSGPPPKKSGAKGGKARTKKLKGP